MTGAPAAEIVREAREVLASFIASHKTVAANLNQSSDRPRFAIADDRLLRVTVVRP